MVPWTHMSQPTNGISIISTIFTQLTDTHAADHAACDMRAGDAA